MQEATTFQSNYAHTDSHDSKGLKIGYHQKYQCIRLKQDRLFVYEHTGWS